MQFLKQSTATQVRELGPFLDDTDFKSVEGGLTIANTDIKIRTHAATTHANKNSGGATHIANGYYHTTFDATDTATVGSFDVHVNVAGALPVWAKFWVLEESIYDALFAASATGFDANQRVNIGAWLGTAVTTSATTAKPEVDVNSISDDGTAASNLEADYDGTGLARANSTIGTVTNITNLHASAATAASIAALNDLSAAQVNAEVDTALVDINLDHLVGTAAPGNPPAGTYLDILADDGTATYDRTTDSLQAQRDTLALEATVAGLNNLSAAQVNAECDTAISDASLATAASIAALNDIAPSDILTTALTESYAADGATFTLSQALYMIWSLMAEPGIVTTVLTAKKLDGTTAAMTFTLDDATTPTSQTRAT